jgi:exodeoxyribonuclease VII small subunit
MVAPAYRSPCIDQAALASAALNESGRVDRPIPIRLFFNLSCRAFPGPEPPAMPESPVPSPGHDAPPLDAGPPVSFEVALAELERIVAQMESGELPLEDCLAAYKRGAQLLHYCQAALRDAQQQVKVLEAGALQDFAPGED